MNETITTIVGNVVDAPKSRRLESGVHVTSFRVASSSRWYDRATSHWVDGESLYLKVTCWRALAENVERCLVKGDPIVVTGKLYTRLYEVDGAGRAAYELQAQAVGFDLNRGVGTFQRLPRRSATVDEVGADGIPTGSAIDAYLEAAQASEEDDLELADRDGFGGSDESAPSAAAFGTENPFDAYGSPSSEGQPFSDEAPSGEADAAPKPRSSAGRRRGANALT